MDLYGIPRPREILVDTADEARKMWEEYQSPVALKVVSESLAHKTEAGGVLLSLDTAEEVLAGAEKLLALADDARLLVQEMIGGGIELLVGISRDETFGPCITAGLGGVYVEALGDVARLLPPFGATQAERALSGLRSRVIFDGFRGGPKVQISRIFRYNGQNLETGAGVETRYRRDGYQPAHRHGGGLHRRGRSDKDEFLTRGCA